MKRKMLRIMTSVLAVFLLLASAVVQTGAAESGSAETAYAGLSSRELAVRAAAEGTVLLKNDGTLPLEKGSKVALFGLNLDANFYAGGGGSGGSNTTDILTYAQALRNAQSRGELSLYAPLMDYYAGRTTGEVPPEDILDGASSFTDTAIVFIGRWSEEGVDRTTTKGSYYLSATEEKLLDAVEARFSHVIVNLNLCAVTDLNFTLDDAVSAVLISWMPGQYGAEALPGVLTGTFNPAGKLPDTFADSYEAYPSSCSFGGEYVEYEEDIFVGYRYFETIPGASDHVLYPFGFGLSYTTFEISGVEIEPHPYGGWAAVRATVKNTGTVAGREVVQVYFGHPEKTKMTYAKKELIGFSKTGELEPGESEQIEIRFLYEDMAAYDDTGAVAKFSYVLEAGEYPIYLGTDVHSSAKAGGIMIDKTTVTRQCQSAGVEEMRLTQRLLADGTYDDIETYYDENEESNVPDTVIFANSSSVLQAENFTSLVGNTQYSISKGSLHNMNHGGTLFYDLSVEEEGEYAVWVRTAQGSLTGKNCLQFSVDGEVADNIVFDMDETTGDWESYKYFDIGTVFLTRGYCELEIKVTNGACGNLDLFRFIPLDGDAQDEDTFDLSSVPAKYAVQGPGKTTLAARDYVSTTNSSLAVSGSGFLQNLHLGGTITYTWYAESSADYLLTLRLACGDSGTAGAMTMSVNGEVQSDCSLSTAGGTGSWETMRDFDAGIITLHAGKNTVVLQPGAGFNLLSFSLERIPGAPASAFEDKEQVADKDILSFKKVAKDPSLMQDFLSQLTAGELMSLVHGGGNSSTWGDLSRYDVPRGTVSDGPAGLRSGTYWPVATMLASTWDPALLTEIGLRIGQEAYERDIDIWLAPALNIHRNPLCGRNFEYYSEDPYLSGVMAGYVVRGTQAQGVAVTIKHLAANNCEAHRNSSDSRMTERALREIYLEGFRVAVKIGKPWGIMTSYNLINGRETAESASILTGIVRGEWGYDGLIMSDWWNDSREDDELLAGNDLKMPEGNPGELTSAFAAGKLDRKVLETSATRVLTLMLKIDRLHRAVDSGYRHVKATSVPLWEEVWPDDTPPETETDETEPIESEQDTVTEAAPKKGCGAVFGTGTLMLLLVFGPGLCAVLYKKKI